jgi:IS30 family transposase
MAYSQLIRDERFYMEKRLSSGELISKRKLAKELGRSHTTIIRELNRNTDKSFGFYSGLRADNLCSEKKHATNRKLKRMNVISKNALDFIILKTSVEISQI